MLNTDEFGCKIAQVHHSIFLHVYDVWRIRPGATGAWLVYGIGGNSCDIACNNNGKIPQLLRTHRGMCDQEIVNRLRGGP